jgi:hypothetical protein
MMWHNFLNILIKPYYYHVHDKTFLYNNEKFSIIVFSLMMVLTIKNDDLCHPHFASYENHIVINWC